MGDHGRYNESRAPPHRARADRARVRERNRAHTTSANICLAGSAACPPACRAGGIVFVGQFGRTESSKTVPPTSYSNTIAHEQPALTTRARQHHTVRYSTRGCRQNVGGMVFLRWNWCRLSGPRSSTVRDTSETWNFCRDASLS